MTINIKGNLLNFSVPKISWFEGAQLNITENCIDRHLDKNGDKTKRHN